MILQPFGCINREEIIMQHFQHSILIDATPAVYAALTTLHGLRGWWSEDCDSDGDTIHMRFGQVHKDFRVTSAQPEREVRWLCSSTPGEARCTDEWVGTEPVSSCSAQGRARVSILNTWA
jgi:hypothetical protein